MSEPLKPDPKWKQVNSDNWQTEDGKVTRNFGPADYAQGFENGAYALAEVLWEKIKGNDLKGVVEILSPYATNTAHPAKGWKHEPIRN